MIDEWEKRKWSQKRGRKEEEKSFTMFVRYAVCTPTQFVYFPFFSSSLSLFVFPSFALSFLLTFLSLSLRLLSLLRSIVYFDFSLPLVSSSSSSSSFSLSFILTFLSLSFRLLPRLLFLLLFSIVSFDFSLPFSTVSHFSTSFVFSRHSAMSLVCEIMKLDRFHFLHSTTWMGHNAKGKMSQLNIFETPFSQRRHLCPGRLTKPHQNSFVLSLLLCCFSALEV